MSISVKNMENKTERDALPLRVKRTIKLFAGHPIQGSRTKRLVWMLKHFRKTKYGRYLESIRGFRLGESCFIIGNGPSLTADDLNILKKNNIDSFAANRIYRIFPRTDWRPTYFINIDHVLIRDVLDEVNAITAKEKFFPVQILLNREFKKKVKSYRLFGNYFKPSTAEFSLDCTDKIRGRGCVTISAIQLAAHMGYRQIYLLDIDHSFTSETDAKGNTTINSDVKKNYFCDDYDDIKTEVKYHTNDTTLGYADAQAFYSKNGVTIKNASRTTRLEVFPKISFEEAVEEISKQKRSAL